LTSSTCPFYSSLTGTIRPLTPVSCITLLVPSTLIGPAPGTIGKIPIRIHNRRGQAGGQRTGPKETWAKPESGEQAYTGTGSRKSELRSRRRVGEIVVVVVFVEQLDTRVYTSCCVEKKGNRNRQEERSPYIGNSTSTRTNKNQAR